MNQGHCTTDAEYIVALQDKLIEAGIPLPLNEPRPQPTALNIGMHKALNAYALGDWDGGDAAREALASAGIEIEPRQP